MLANAIVVPSPLRGLGCSGSRIVHFSAEGTINPVFVVGGIDYDLFKIILLGGTSFSHLSMGCLIGAESIFDVLFPFFTAIYTVSIIPNCIHWTTAH